MLDFKMQQMHTNTSVVQLSAELSGLESSRGRNYALRDREGAIEAPRPPPTRPCFEVGHFHKNLRQQTADTRKFVISW